MGATAVRLCRLGRGLATAANRSLLVGLALVQLALVQLALRWLFRSRFVIEIEIGTEIETVIEIVIEIGLAKRKRWPSKESSSWF